MEFLLICATWIENAGRFLTLEDAFVRASVLGAVLLGLNCGALGSFLVVRRMSLVGDTLSPAVLPGIVGGYLWNQTKDPVAMLIGAIGLCVGLTVSPARTISEIHDPFNYRRKTAGHKGNKRIIL